MLRQMIIAVCIVLAGTVFGQDVEQAGVGAAETNAMDSVRWQIDEVNAALNTLQSEERESRVALKKSVQAKWNLDQMADGDETLTALLKDIRAKETELTELRKQFQDAVAAKPSYRDQQEQTDVSKSRIETLRDERRTLMQRRTELVRELRRLEKVAPPPKHVIPETEQETP